MMLEVDLAYTAATVQCLLLHGMSCAGLAGAQLCVRLCASACRQAAQCIGPMSYRAVRVMVPLTTHQPPEESQLDSKLHWSEHP